MLDWSRCSRVLMSAAVLGLTGCGPDTDTPAGTPSDSDTESSETQSTAAGSSTTQGTASTVATSADPTQASETSDPTQGEGSTGEDMAGDRLELRVDDFLVPEGETSYACFEFSFRFDQLGHITGFAPVIDNGAHVHHFVLTVLDQPTGNPDGYSCFDLNGEIIWAWAPGVTDFELPAEAGFLAGNAPDGRLHLRLQVHYNNPQAAQDARDSSGLDMFVTNDLRPNNAGTLVVADVQGITIPPGLAAHEHVTTCASAVTQAVFSEPIHVFGSSMHAHDIGSVLYTEVWRDGAMLYELNRDDPFLFDSQRLNPVDRIIEPGDEIINRCIYDSTSRDEVTIGGPGTLDEMCWNTLLYYPKIGNGFDMCGSGF